MSDHEASVKFQQARHFYEQEQWKDALRLADELSVTLKSHKDVMYLQAACLARLGNREEAELLCDQLSIMHNDPRGARLKAELPHAKREGKVVEAVKEPFRLPRFVIPTVVGVAVVGGALVVVPSIVSRMSASIPEPVPYMERPAERVVQFPADRSVGELTVRDWTHDPSFRVSEENPWVGLGQAKGEVTVPPGKELRLQVMPDDVLDLSPLARLGAHDLQAIYLGNTAAGDADLVHLKRLTGLRHLNVAETNVTGAGLAALARLTSLEDLNVNGLALDDMGRDFIVSRPLLRDLQADGIGATDAWLAALCEHADIRYLTLDYNTALTDAGLKHIGKLKSLVDLFVSYTVLTDEGLAELQTIPTLKRLWMEGTAVSDASIQGFYGMPQITAIGLAKTRITDKSLESLKELKRLKKIDITACANLSDKAIKSLKEALPNCTVETTGEVSDLPPASAG
ncbi:MAG: hypothetical protein K1Y02_23955 [Candidatus Hydrogenedentes bacterium]|nr:hypothetical protein [Candidatus Hydrogenedentota bacterium]